MHVCVCVSRALLLLCSGQVTGLCAPDLFHANMVAREMILSAGMGRKLGEHSGSRCGCSADAVEQRSAAASYW